MFYALECPRGFANEINAVVFRSKEHRDTWVDRGPDDYHRWRKVATKKQALAVCAANRATARAHRADSAYPQNMGATEPFEKQQY